MNRNRDLFWNLVEPEHLRARAFCRKLMGNREDGDDLYQDVLVRALTRLASLKDVAAFRPWLYRIVINEFKNQKRRPWWRRVLPMTQEVAETVRIDGPAAQLAARRRLETAFSVLSDEDRALVTLFEMHGWKISELAALAGKTEGNIKVRLSRARKKMRDTLSRYFESSARVGLKQIPGSEDEICVVTKPGKE